MGIHELGHRKALLRKISEYREQQETEEAKGLKEKKEKVRVTIKGIKGYEMFIFTCVFFMNVVS